MIEQAKDRYDELYATPDRTLGRAGGLTQNAQIVLYTILIHRPGESKDKRNPPATGCCSVVKNATVHREHYYN